LKDKHFVYFRRVFLQSDKSMWLCLSAILIISQCVVALQEVVKMVALQPAKSPIWGLLGRDSTGIAHELAKEDAAKESLLDKLDIK